MSSKTATKVANKSPVPLTEYARAKRLEACPVCKLPDAIRTQIAEARGRRIFRDTVLEWLREEVGVTLTTEDLDGHQKGHHDK